MAREYRTSMSGLVDEAIKRAIEGKTFIDREGKPYSLRTTSELRVNGEIIIDYHCEPGHASRDGLYHDHLGDQMVEEQATKSQQQ